MLSTEYWVVSSGNRSISLIPTIHSLTSALGCHSIQMKIDHQRQMIGRAAGQLAARDVGVPDHDAAAAERLVQGHHRQERGKRAKVRWRGRNLRERVVGEGIGRQRVSPVVAI